MPKLRKDISKDSLIALIKEYPHEHIKTLSARIGLSKNGFHYHLKKHGILRSNHYFNHNFFATIDSEEKAYWLGFLMADGYICDSSKGQMKLIVNLGKKDYNHLNKWHKTISS